MPFQNQKVKVEVTGVSVP